MDGPTKRHHKGKPVIAGTVLSEGEVQDEDGRQFAVEGLNPVIVAGAQGMIKNTIPRLLDTPAGGEDMRTVVTWEVGVPLVAEVAGPGVLNALIGVDGRGRAILPAPSSIGVVSATQKFDVVSDEEGRGLIALSEVGHEPVDVRGTPFGKTTAEMMQLVRTQVICVGGGASYVVGDDQPLNDQHFQALIVQLW